MVRQGDIIFIDFDPIKGHEQKGRRPALVISNDIFNRKAGGLALLLPITSKYHSHPLRVDVECGEIKGQVLVAHVRSLDLNARHYQYVETLDRKTLGYIISLFKAEF
ncbi:MAG: type II toxin-antitoxin system PemK/MazF family toxin [Bacilli bacterium]|nr:type II toxin-antitoxin system PemK/MazF family toxin [Bacilli bacterium]